MSLEKQYSHYHRRLPSGLTHLDVYGVLRLFEVEDSALAHAIKKLLCAGKRGAKSREKDLKEARDSITRALELDEAFAENPSDIIKTPYDNCTAFDFGPSVSKEQAQAVIRKILSCNAYSPSNRLLITNAPPGTLSGPGLSPDQLLLIVEPVPARSAPTTDYGCCSVLPATEAERIVWVLNNEGPFTKDKPLKVHRAPPGTSMKIEFKYLSLIEWV